MNENLPPVTPEGIRDEHGTAEKIRDILTESYDSSSKVNKFLHPQTKEKIEKDFISASRKIDGYAQKHIEMLQTEALKENAKKYLKELQQADEDLFLLNDEASRLMLPLFTQDVIQYHQNFESQYGIPVTDPKVLKEHEIRLAIKYGVIDQSAIPPNPNPMLGDRPNSDWGLSMTNEELNEKTKKAIETKKVKIQQKINEINKSIDG